MRALVYACLFILAACSSDSNREQAALDAVVIVYTTAQGSAHGSGVVVGQGLILTAGHVSRGRETFIAFRDGEIVAGKEVKMALEGPAPDLALVYAPTGDREAVSVRCTPVAVGEPLYTVGHPVVSRWTVIWGKVAPGSSGGPVFDSDGNLVGVATALLNAPMPMGFGSISVPTSLAIIQSPATICEFLLDA